MVHFDETATCPDQEVKKRFSKIRMSIRYLQTIYCRSCRNPKYCETVVDFLNWSTAITSLLQSFSQDLLNRES
ncbi:hypothetical protein KIN20_026426 [Parelaphostrongylus tenuis]|uniref:Uncharacterized protein n=1 Tax=Parelaphostrongylus tenuis TaxID=148309 RepID=A0AAD5QY47_PARTN|nr:hypothetical protein KIN20_026426 [Parelaphostrongylus tenuis]